MVRVSIEEIVKLQKEISSIRNVCILAHVDHGKTTLADALVSSNGIISSKLVGKLRYMDSREDEQVKGITMKSSSISLYYRSNEDRKEYLVNLIDSPGHIDFYGEVSSVVRLCDGAIILVDVVEGVCPQTHAVLRQAWIQNIKPVLVLNKIDRLVLELKITPDEAEIKLMQLLEQVNAITGELFASEVFAKSAQDNQKANMEEIRHQFELHEWGSGLEDFDDSLLYFSPDQQNVVFSSAVDVWGFRISKFSSLYSKKLGISGEILNKTLWGDFYLDSKSKSVKRGARAKGKKTLFVQLILENIWKVYDYVCIKKDETLINKIIEALGLDVHIKQSDLKSTLQSILNQWLPLSDSILDMVCHILPDPKCMSQERLLTFLQGKASIGSIPPETLFLQEDLSKSNPSHLSPVIIFISKMFPIEAKYLPKNQPKQLTMEEMKSRRETAIKKRFEARTRDNEIISTEDINEERPKDESDQVLIAFARIFSGTIKKGQCLYVFGPRHDPNIIKTIDLQSPEIETTLKNLNIMKFQVKDLYLLMGRELKNLDEVPAGNILGIGGLEELVFKSASLSDNLFCPPFTDLYQEVSPIVRVAVEPKFTADMEKLICGLKLLNQSDPCVEIFIQETGEHILVTAGEVHLDKCLNDLRERFGKIEINVSSPTVPFRETIVSPPILDRVNEVIADQGSKSKHVETHHFHSVDLISESWHLTVRAIPLSRGVIKILSDKSQLLKLFVKNIGSEKLTNIFDHKLLSDLNDLKERLDELFCKDMGVDKGFVDRIWSVDPRRNCTNLLINQVLGYDRPSFWDLAECSNRSLEYRLRSMDRSIINGFEMAVDSGPLCEEPMSGVCLIVENWIEIPKHLRSKNKKLNSGSQEKLNGIDEIYENDSEIQNSQTEVLENKEIVVKPSENNGTVSDSEGPIQFKSSLISCMKECCKKAFQAQPQRLMWAIYTCVIQATSDVLGKMYGVLGKRHGRILREEMREGSTLFEVTAVIPVVESFGFTDEFRKKTSGLAMPQLKFSHWEVVDIDPFWVPTTEEEYMHFGEKSDNENIARKYMNDIRRRKGLKTNEKLVEFAEKQRTLKRNK